MCCWTVLGVSGVYEGNPFKLTRETALQPVEVYTHICRQHQHQRHHAAIAADTDSHPNQLRLSMHTRGPHALLLDTDFGTCTLLLARVSTLASGDFWLPSLVPTTFSATC